MRDWTEQEIAEMLRKVFPPKPEPVASELPRELREVVETAQAMGLENIPPIILDPVPSHLEWGKVDFHTYSRTTIQIRTHWVALFDGVTPLTTEQMRRTLAHELGHWDQITTTDGGTYESSGFKACEDWADAYRDRLLAELAA